MITRQQKQIKELQYITLYYRPRIPLLCTKNYSLTWRTWIERNLPQKVVGLHTSVLIAWTHDCYFQMGHTDCFWKLSFTKSRENNNKEVHFSTLFVFIASIAFLNHEILLITRGLRIRVFSQYLSGVFEVRGQINLWSVISVKYRLTSSKAFTLN